MAVGDGGEYAIDCWEAPSPGEDRREGGRTRIGERDLWEVEDLLWCYLYESTSSIGHPPVDTFASILNPEVAMIQIAVELIPEFLEDLDPRLCLVAFDLHPFEFVLTIY